MSNLDNNIKQYYLGRISNPIKCLSNDPQMPQNYFWTSFMNGMKIT